MKLTAKAFAPGAISSFFEIHDTQNGKPIVDLEKVGAVGGRVWTQKRFHNYSDRGRSGKKTA